MASRTNSPVPRTQGGVRMAPIVRGMGLETYIKTLGPSTQGKSTGQLKLEAYTKTGINPKSSGGCETY